MPVALKMQLSNNSLEKQICEKSTLFLEVRIDFSIKIKFNLMKRLRFSKLNYFSIKGVKP